MQKFIKFNEEELEVLKVILNYMHDEHRFIDAMETADLLIDDDRLTYETLCTKVMGGN